MVRILTIQGNLDAVTNVLQNVLPSLEEVKNQVDVFFKYFISVFFMYAYTYYLHLLFAIKGIQDPWRANWSRWRF